MSLWQALRALPQDLVGLDVTAGPMGWRSEAETLCLVGAPPAADLVRLAVLPGKCLGRTSGARASAPRGPAYIYQRNT